MKFHYITFLLFLNLCVLTSTSAQNNFNNFLQCLTSKFQASNSTQNLIFTPQINPSSFSSIFHSSVRSLRYTTTSSVQRPLAIITPYNESEIQSTVRCARKYNIEIKVRSGGHDYEGLSYESRNSFVIIDMRNLRSITVDTEDETAWIQAGAQLGEVYYTVAQASRTLAFSAGICPTVGIGGYLSGGGYGMMARNFGIAVDHIIDAVIVNANGEVLDRDSMGDDLFWAIRGGGGASFGVIVAFKVTLVTVPEIVTVFNVSRTLEQNATELVHKWQYISDNIDENLGITVFIRSVRSSSNANNRTIQASFASLFLGRVENLLPVMNEKFPELGLVEQDCIEMSWVESTVYFPEYPPGTPITILLNRTQPSLSYFKSKSDYVIEPIPEHGLRGLWNYLNKEEENAAELFLGPYGGAISRVPESATPFPHREGVRFILHYGIWTNDNAQRHLNWSRRLYAYMEPFVSKSPRQAYLNYRDLDLGRNNEEGNTSYEQASVWGFKYYKNNFDRLVRVKTNVDPTNFFRNDQSIPPAAEMIKASQQPYDLTY